MSRHEQELAYERQAMAFLLHGTPTTYHPLNNLEFKDGNSEINSLYINLACYKRQTGNELTVADVEDYLSKEYEEDGRLRLYTNGQHPAIQQYVEWAYPQYTELNDYHNEIVFLLGSELNNMPEYKDVEDIFYQIPMKDMMKPLAPFLFFSAIPMMFLVTFLPELSLWLPKLVLGAVN